MRWPPRRVQDQQTLKDPRWKTGPALRTALDGKWRSPIEGWNSSGEGWDFNADGTCIFYRSTTEGFGKIKFFVARRGKYHFPDDSHVEMVTTLPPEVVNGQPNPEEKQRYKVLVDDKESIFVDDTGARPGSGRRCYGRCRRSRRGVAETFSNRPPNSTKVGCTRSRPRRAEKRSSLHGMSSARGR